METNPGTVLTQVGKYAKEKGISTTEVYRRIRGGEIQAIRHPHKRATLVIDKAEPVNAV